MRVPRNCVGAISAKKTGTTAAFPPMPTPRIDRQIKRLHHLFMKALAMVDARMSTAETRMARRRPMRSSLRGSERKEPLCKSVGWLDVGYSLGPYTGLNRKGAALTAPYFQAVSGRHTRDGPSPPNSKSINGSRKQMLAPADETSTISRRLRSSTCLTKQYSTYRWWLSGSTLE